MKRLGKQQQARHVALVSQLTFARDDLNSAIAGFNDAVARLHAEMLAPRVAAANAAITAVNTFVEEVHSDQESYFDDRTDNWRDGDAGQSYSDWMSEWEVSLDELELEAPVPFDAVELDVEEFAQLEAEVSS